MRPIRDHSGLFTLVVVVSWIALVAVPLGLSLWFNASILGTPAVGVVIWLLLIRFARRLSPAARADSFIRSGRYREALTLCDDALAVKGTGAWNGTRRLVWLNRRTDILLMAGRSGEALTTALDAIRISPDAETLAHAAMALLLLNRYEEADRIARYVQSLTRERSVSANIVLAHLRLAEGKPGEAEALALAARYDVRALLPFARPTHYAQGLAVLIRAERMLGKTAQALRFTEDLMRLSRRDSSLRAIALIAEAENADSGQAEHALKLLEQAARTAPDLVAWSVTQPGTFSGLRATSQFDDIRAWAQQRVEERRAEAPSAEVVADVLSATSGQASGRPGHQSSVIALIIQVAALIATLLLLIFWIWHFFVIGG